MYLLVIPYLVFSFVALVSALFDLIIILGPLDLVGQVKVAIKAYEGAYWNPIHVVFLLPVLWAVVTVFGAIGMLLIELVRHFVHLPYIEATGWQLLCRTCSVMTLTAWLLILGVELHRRRP